MAGHLMSLSNSSDSEEEAPVALFLEKLNLGPTKKKLLVLDVAGVLCDRVFAFGNKRLLHQRQPDAVCGSFLVFKRPYCQEFLDFCFQRFEVGVWSSAKRHNLKDALDCVMGKLQSRLLFVWDQDECTDSGFHTMENQNKPIFFKELKKLWKKYSCHLPSKTLLIDDKPYKALLNPPHTAIFPTEYKAEHVNDTALRAGGELRAYLDGVAKADDVPSYLKGKEIGQPAITPNHPLWFYYSKIIQYHSKK